MILFSLLSRSSHISFFLFSRIIVSFRLPSYVLLKKRTFISRIMLSSFFKGFLYFFNKLKTNSKQYLLFLIRAKTIIGLRHVFNLPVNGQRSKTNANTRRRLGVIASPSKRKA